MLKESSKIMLGNRIAILGPSCVGKSTLAQTLAKKYKIPALHLDVIAHKPNTNWERTDTDLFLKHHDNFIKQDRWVIEGNYSMTMPQRFEKATSVIWLKEQSIFNLLWVYIKRCFQKKERAGIPLNMGAEFSFEMIYYILAHTHKNVGHYDQLLKDYPNLPVTKIKGRKALNEFYAHYSLEEIRDQILNKDPKT